MSVYCITLSESKDEISSDNCYVNLSSLMTLSVGILAYKVFPMNESSPPL